MEQDTSHSIVETADHNDLVQGAFNLSGSVGDLLSLQNGSGSVLGAGATPEAASNHLSQGDLEALASISQQLCNCAVAPTSYWSNHAPTKWRGHHQRRG